MSWNVADSMEDIHEVVSSWIMHKDPIPESWTRNGETSAVNPMKLAEIQALGLAGRSKLQLRVQKTLFRLKNVSDILNSLASAIQLKTDAARENLDAVNNMCGLFSIPNELVARILYFVVHGEEDLQRSTRWKAAVTLSHVCQYFRETTLSCSQLWSSVSHGGMMTSALLSRSKNLPLNVGMAVGFEVDSEGLRFEDSFVTLKKHVNRWRSFGVQISFASGADRIATIRKQMPLCCPTVRKAFRQIDAPMLESLHIENEKGEYNLFGNYDEFALWNTPRLRRVTSINYFPRSLPGLVNVTTLDITVILTEILSFDLLEDLSRMSSLEDFRLKLDCQSYFRESVLPRPQQKTELSSVRRLKIETYEFPTCADYHVRSLFSALSFPGAVHLRVRLNRDMTKSHPEDKFLSYNYWEEISGIFCSVGQFPSVKYFHLEAYAERDPQCHPVLWAKDYEGSISLPIPIDLLPGVQHLTLLSNMWLDAVSWEKRWRSRVRVSTCPALETITIGPMAKSVAEWTEKVLRKQKESGQWTAFKELILVQGHEARDGCKTTVVGTHAGEEALTFCESLTAYVNKEFRATTLLEDL